MMMMMMVLVHLLLRPARGQQRPAPESAAQVDSAVNYWIISLCGLISLCLGTINLTVIPA